MNILVINCGSSSLKYQLIDMENEKCIAKGICERINAPGSAIESRAGDKRVVKEVPMEDHTQAFHCVIKALCEGECKVIDDVSVIGAVGHRIVQGGDIYNKSVLIDDEVITNIEKLSPLAPLHNPAHIKGIKACINVLGDNVPQVAVFDNAFHSTMPEEAYLFGIPKEYYDKPEFGVKLRRYGAHGTSHKYVAGECAKLMGRDIEQLKIITCHIGNGASITAVKYGKVIDTSMGLTPLGGIMMGTRCGDLDPSVVTFLQKRLGWTAEQTEENLNNQCGLYGLSGYVSSDDRDLVKAAAEGNEDARTARLTQHYQIKKTIGAYAAAMDGVDAIVFTAGLGENNSNLRENVCSGLTYLGVDIDREYNKELIHGKGGKFSTEKSAVQVFVIPTNEELMIARETIALVEER